MSRPNLGYSNYYWIRKDQMRLKKEAQKRQEPEAELNEPTSELNGELTSETTPVQTHNESTSSSLLEAELAALEAELPKDRPDSIFNEPQESTALLVVGQNVSAWGSVKSVEK